MNASEQGLAFHAANAVRQPGPIRLSISPIATQRLELAAEIVWMDDAKKFGGLRFTKVTAHARNEIRQWLAETEESMIPDADLEVPTYPSQDESDPRPVAERRATGLPRIISSLEGARRHLDGHATLSVPGFSPYPVDFALVRAMLAKKSDIFFSRSAGSRSRIRHSLFRPRIRGILVLSKCSSGGRELAHPFWAEAQTRYGYANGNFFIAPCSDCEPWFGEPSARPRPNSRVSLN